MVRTSLRAAFLGVVLTAGPAAAQGPLGNEFAVNVYTTNVQNQPQLAADARGNFVVVWQSYRQDGDRHGLFGRRFDRLGRPRGPEFQVNVTTAGNQFNHHVASDAAGNFLVVWRTDTANGQHQFVRRRFDRAGAPGPELPITAPALGGSIGALAMHADGNALMVWHLQNAVRAQRFDPAGAPVGGELALVTGFPILPNAAAAPDGGYLLIWGAMAQVDQQVLGRRLNAAGSPAGAEFRMNTYTTVHVEPGAVAFEAGGGFMVTWNETPGSPSSVRALARRYDAAGNPIGPGFLVSDDNAQMQCCANLAGDRDGNFTALWSGNNVDFDVYARRFDPSGAPLGGRFRVPFNPNFFQESGGIIAPRGGHTVTTYASSAGDADQGGVLGRPLGSVAMQLVVDAAPLQSNGNGVLEAGETVTVAPDWSNAENGAAMLTGVLSEFEGPGTSAYTLVDGAAAYGNVGPGQAASCTNTGDCYALSVSVPPFRPATHWDASVRERVSGLGDITWALHVGASFTDVTGASPFYRFVETLLHHGVSAGCTSTLYCPAALTTREQMAVLMLAGKEGPGYQPAACTTPMFNDVPAGSPFCRFIEELARRGVVSGCAPGSYCPTAAVTREQMAVFTLRTLDPALDPPACGTPLFGDVPADSPFCRWIEELVRRGVVTGCGGGNFCPAQAISREQVAVFVAGAFGLSLYGP